MVESLVPVVEAIRLFRETNTEFCVEKLPPANNVEKTKENANKIGGQITCFRMQGNSNERGAVRPCRILVMISCIGLKVDLILQSAPHLILLSYSLWRKFNDRQACSVLGYSIRGDKVA